jgi:hypothetical protein
MSATSVYWDVEQAKKSQDWLFLFTAAERICITRTDISEDPVHTRRRQQVERDKLRALTHTYGTYTKWQTKFRNQIEVCQSVKCDLNDLDKLSYLMDNINKDIFKRILEDWESPVRMQSLPKTYADMLVYLDSHIERMINQHPAIIRKVELTKPSTKNESVFSNSTNAKKNSGDEKLVCDICEHMVGVHDTDNCPYRHKRYSVESNRKFFLRKMGTKEKDDKEDTQESLKTKEMQSKWNPTKGTTVKPSREET